MDKLKFALFSVVTLTLLGLASYWAIATIQTGSEHVSTDKIKKLESENENLKKEMKILKDDLSFLQSEVNNEKKEIANEELKPTIEKQAPVPAKAYKYQELINELQKLVDANALLKLKSSGARVGTIQKFLNIYNKTSNKLDNDFGESTKKEVIEFQKDQGLSGDGEAGKTTFSKMINWLKKQG